MRDADGDHRPEGEHADDGARRGDARSDSGHGDPEHTSAQPATEHTGAPQTGTEPTGHGAGSRRGHGGSTVQVVRTVLLDARRALRSPNRNARSAVVLGRLLGLAFFVCFGTGIFSHLLQDPLPGMRFATRPVQLYQFTQGLHITAGIAIIPLLFGKLNAVMPALLQTPPVRGVLHLLERLSIAILVAGALVQVFTGLVNTFQWYPWPFPFRQTHFALSFLVIGALVVHIGVKLPIIVRYWRARDAYDRDGRFVEDRTVGSELLPDDDGLEARPAAPTSGLVGRVMRWIDGADAPAERRAGTATPELQSERAGAPDAATVPEPIPAGAGGPPEPTRTSRQTDVAADGRRQRIARRGFFGGVAAAVAGVVVLTSGQSTNLTRPFNLFAPRERGIGPNDLPVNRTARAAGVLATATAADWELTVGGPSLSRTFSRAELVALGTAEVDLPISCVEGWSQMAHWKGVRVRDLLAAVGAPSDSHVRVTSLEQHGGYRIMDMGPEYASDPTTLLALELNGGTLDLEHGFPARIIAPGRPGVLQTKWVSKIEVVR